LHGLPDLVNSSGVVLSNSTVLRVGSVFGEYAVGVSAVGGMRVLNNEIGLTPWSPVHTVLPGGGAAPDAPFPAGGAQVEIARNLLHDYGLGVLSDMGGVYLDVFPKGVRNATWLRAHVHDNVLLRASCYAGGYGANGLYNDDGASGVVWERNIVSGVGGHALSLHCGVDAVVHNNLFYNNSFQNFTTSRKQWGAVSGCNGVAADIGLNASFVSNIAVVPATNPSTFDALDAWVSAGPPVRALASDRNVWHALGGAQLTFAGGSLSAWRDATGNDRASVDADPAITDASSGDFSLLPASPAWALGWQALAPAGDSGPVPDA
jgi:hypothetical protein